MSNEFENPFIKLVFPKKVKPLLFWGIITLIVFIICGAFVTIFQPRLWPSVIFFSYVLFLGPWLSFRFQKFLNEILPWGEQILGPDFQKILKRLFVKGMSLSNRGCIITALTVIILFNLSLVYSWQPGIPMIPTIVSIIVIQPSVFICGQTAYFLIVLIIFFMRISKLTPLAYFKHEPISFVDSILKTYSIILLAVTIAYFLLVGSIACSPFGFNFIMLIWSSVLALWPLTFFISIFYSNRNFRKEFKQHKLEHISTKLEDYYNNLDNLPENIDRMKKLYEIYQSILRERVSGSKPDRYWQILLAFSTLITQILVTLASIGVSKGQDIISVLKELIGFQ